MIRAAILFLSLFVLQIVFGSTEDNSTRTWALEDYNDWNLPFAKTVEIQGLSGGNYTH